MCPTFTHLFRKMVFKSLQKKIAHDSLLLHFENHGEILGKVWLPYNLLDSHCLAQKNLPPPPSRCRDRDTFPAYLHVVEIFPKELGSFSIDDLIIRNTPERAPEAKDETGNETFHHGFFPSQKTCYTKMVKILEIPFHNKMW